MATPMSADGFLAALRRWGVGFHENAGWRTHNRNAVGAWGPVQGVMIHHTGDDAPDGADRDVLVKGRGDLPGPLCHWGMRDDGTVELIGWGRANHAGRGARNVLDALVARRPLPPPGADAVDGNAVFYGQETMYGGTVPPDPRAYRATVRVFAAVCEHHGWPASVVLGHREWTARKPDPGHLDLDILRRDVAAALASGPVPRAVVPAVRPKRSDDDMLYKIGGSIYAPGGDQLNGRRKLYRVTAGDAEDVDGGLHDYIDVGIPVVTISLTRVRAIGYAVQGSDF